MTESSYQPHPDGPATKSLFVSRQAEMEALKAVLNGTLPSHGHMVSWASA